MCKSKHFVSLPHVLHLRLVSILYCGLPFSLSFPHLFLFCLSGVYRTVLRCLSIFLSVFLSGVHLARSSPPLFHESLQLSSSFHCILKFTPHYYIFIFMNHINLLPLIPLSHLKMLRRHFCQNLIMAQMTVKSAFPCLNTCHTTPP